MLALRAEYSRKFNQGTIEDASVAGLYVPVPAEVRVMKGVLGIPEPVSPLDADGIGFFRGRTIPEEEIAVLTKRSFENSLEASMMECNRSGPGYAFMSEFRL